MQRLQALTLGALLVAAAFTHAADATTPAPATPPAPPPTLWDRALSATVLIGSDVGVGADASLSPKPILLHLDDLKRLHDVGGKATECVFDGDATGNLSAERVAVRITTLRCFDADGGTLLNKPVHGYVFDQDARTGIKGTVAWGQAAKDLTMLGTGGRVRDSLLMKGAQTALSRATFGIGDDMITHDKDRDRNEIPQDVLHDLRSADTLLPVLTVEPGRKLRVVLLGGVQ